VPKKADDPGWAAREPSSPRPSGREVVAAVQAIVAELACHQAGTDGTWRLYWGEIRPRLRCLGHNDGALLWALYDAALAGFVKSGVDDFRDMGFVTMPVGGGKITRGTMPQYGPWPFLVFLPGLATWAEAQRPKPRPRGPGAPRPDTNALLTAALSAHHRYSSTATPDALDTEPAGVRELAEGKGVKLAPATISRWFRTMFGGYMTYCRQWADAATLLHALRLLNGDTPPSILERRVQSQDRE